MMGNLHITGTLHVRNPLIPPGPKRHSLHVAVGAASTCPCQTETLPETACSCVPLGAMLLPPFISPPMPQRRHASSLLCCHSREDIFFNRLASPHHPPLGRPPRSTPPVPSCWELGRRSLSHWAVAPRRGCGSRSATSDRSAARGRLCATLPVAWRAAASRAASVVSATILSAARRFSARRAAHRCRALLGCCPGTRRLLGRPISYALLRTAIRAPRLPSAFARTAWSRHAAPRYLRSSWIVNCLPSRCELLYPSSARHALLCPASHHTVRYCALPDGTTGSGVSPPTDSTGTILLCCFP